MTECSGPAGGLASIISCGVDNKADFWLQRYDAVTSLRVVDG